MTAVSPERKLNDEQQVRLTLMRQKERGESRSPPVSATLAFPPNLSPNASDA